MNNMRRLDRTLQAAWDEMEQSQLLSYERLAAEYPEDTSLQMFVQTAKEEYESKITKRVLLQKSKYQSLLFGVLMMTSSAFGTILPTFVLPGSAYKIESKIDNKTK